MTSTETRFAQNVTRNFVVTNSASTGNGVYFFDEADVDTWYAANKSAINKLGSIYIIPGTTSGKTLVDVLQGNNGASSLAHNLANISDRKTLKDMGKEVIIGNSVDTRLLVLRRVQIPVGSLTGVPTNPDYTGYVVVENNCDDLGTNAGRFTVKVARI